MQITAVFISGDETKKEEKVQFDNGDIKTMQRYVEGNFDVIDLDKVKASIWFNDEMAINGAAINYRATFLLWVYRPEYVGQPIRGNVLITGLPNKAGNTLTAPRKLVDLLFGTPRYKVIWRFKGKKQVNRMTITFTDWPTAFEYAYHLMRNNKRIESVEVVPAS